MNDAIALTATGSEGSTQDQAATELLNWESMEVRFLARAEAEGREGIVRFGSQADLMEFLTAHQPACSTATLEKSLASQGRTATDDWSWEDFKDVAMRCQEIAPKTNMGNQLDATSELCEKLWTRWQQNEFPLSKTSECKDSSQMNLALAITACLTEEVKPAIRDSIAEKH